MGAFANLLGTVLSSFGIGPKTTRATLDASGLTASRTFLFPDAAGTIALTSGVVDLTNNQNIGGLKTFTGIGGIVAFNASGAQIIVASAAGADSKVNLRAGAASNKTRWELTKNSTAEGGSNAGSDFDLNAFDDSGSLLSRIFRATRSTGVLDFTNTPTVGGTAVAKTSDLPTSGTYTPTASGVTNIASIGTVSTFRYVRIGNVVFVSGTLAVTPSGSGNTSFSLTPPIASTLGDSTNDASGCANTQQAIGGGGAFVRCDGAGKLLVAFTAAAGTQVAFRIEASYTIN